MTRKTQKKLRKLLTLVSCAVLLVCVTIVGTIAYLSDTTEVVANTFTADANVKITLTEEDVDQYGESYPDEHDRVMANEYKMIPGHEYKKDPTVFIDSKSEDCWVFVKVDINVDEATTKTIKSQMESKWTCVDEDDNIWGYKTKLSNSSEETKSAVAFTTFTLADNYGNDADTNAMSINITGYAVQADGFETVSEAWNAAPCAGWDTTVQG